jgi:hypothetical protein
MEMEWVMKELGAFTGIGTFLISFLACLDVSYRRGFLERANVKGWDSIRVLRALYELCKNPIGLF